MYLVVQEEDLLLKRLAEATGVNPLYLYYNKLNMFNFIQQLLFLKYLDGEDWDAIAMELGTSRPPLSCFVR